MTLSEGLQLFKEGKYDQASEKLLEVVQNDENNHKAWNALGVVLSKSGQTEDAQSCFENAVQLDPNNSTYQKNLDKIIDKKEKKIQPLKPITNTKKIDQKDPFIPVLLSLFFPGLGQVYNGLGGVAGLLRGIACSIGYAFFVLPGLIIHLYLIYDSYKVRKSMNNGEISVGCGEKRDYVIYFIPFILIIATVIISAIIAGFVFGVSSIPSQTPVESNLQTNSPKESQSEPVNTKNIVYQHIFKDNNEIPHTSEDIEFYGTFADMYDELVLLDGKSMNIMLGIKSWDTNTLSILDQIGQEKSSTIKEYVSKIESLKISNELYSLRDKIIKDVTMQSDLSKYYHQAYLYAEKGDMNNVQLTMSQFTYAVAEQSKYQKEVLHADPLMQKMLQIIANSGPINFN